MRTLSNPKWLFVVNTLPLLLLFGLVYAQFQIIKSLLDSQSIQLWKIFAGTLVTLCVLNFAYALYLSLTKRSVSFWYGVAALLCYIPFIYLYGYHLEKILPSSIPQWMIPDNLFLYAGTFLMPTLAYALFLLVVHFTPDHKNHHAWKNFLTAICVPILGYLFSLIVNPLWQHVNEDYFFQAVIVLVIVGTLVFLFFLVRGVFIIVSKKSTSWSHYQLAFKIPISIVLPVLGLLVNNGIMATRYIDSTNGVFGNFSNQWFYILAVINGLVICMPNLGSKQYRLLLFIARSITFSYTLYFFLVFLPFLPLSVFAILIVGAGFLMLTPLVLFIVHCNDLSKDYRFLQSFYPTKTIRVGLVLGTLVIPASITINYLQDKRTLNQTLSYLYTPDYSKEYNLNRKSIKAVLEVVQKHKERNRDIVFAQQTPYLSSYFNWLVLDNLTLSDAKINTIERVFFDTASFQVPQPNFTTSQDIVINNIYSESSYDTTQKAWRSWINLEIKNNSTSWQNEYVTKINLPDGCWISDYYLYVGDKKEHGILAEKKAAMWVYSQIVNVQRDPGILHYINGNEVGFRVFPFEKNQIRKTGMELLHKDPVQITIDDRKVSLGKQDQLDTKPTETEHMLYVSALQKKQLKLVQRKPYYHFLVDVSASKKELVADFTNRIKQALQLNTALSQNAQISFVNSYVQTTPLTDNWQNDFKKITHQGGFYLEQGIKMALVEAYKNNSYPIIVVVTDALQNAIIEKPFSDFKFIFPENDHYYLLNEKGGLQAYSLINNPLQQVSDSGNYVFNQNVLVYSLSNNTNVYLPNNNEASIYPKKDTFELKEENIIERNWASALEMQGQWVSQKLHPETTHKIWLQSVKNSFRSKVMTPVTAYLVVENEAQKAILKKKQEQVLTGNASLDLGEDVQRMSEPAFWIVASLAGIALWYRERKKKKMQSH